MENLAAAVRGHVDAVLSRGVHGIDMETFEGHIWALLDLIRRQPMLRYRVVQALEL